MDPRLLDAQRYLARNLSQAEFDHLLAEVVADAHGMPVSAAVSVMGVNSVYEALAERYAWTMAHRHMAHKHAA